jgi:hypothetical protein
MKDSRASSAGARADEASIPSGPAPGRSPRTAGLAGPTEASPTVQRRALAVPAELPPPGPALEGGLAEAFAAPVQRRAEAGPPSTEAVHEAAADAVATPTQALPYREELEASMGRDLSGVQAHVGGAAEDAAHAAGAEALATGAHVVLPDNASRFTVAHEVAHVFQQQDGVQLQGGVGASGDRYEQHADEVAAAVVAGEPTGHLLGGAGAGGAGAPAGAAVQRFDRHNATGPEGRGPNTVSSRAATRTDADFKSFADINAGTVSDFVAYMDAQADWSMEITDEAERDSLRTFAVWLRAGSHRITGLGNFLVSGVLAVRADLAALDAYCRARAETVPTVPVNEATTIADARAWGLDIVKLEAAVAGAVLHTIFTADWFEHLRTEGKLDLFCTYARTRSPLLHARGGVEIDSFLTLAATVDPSTYADLGDVRNPHRFQQLALDRLRANQAGNPGNLPLTLILHSAFDHNGAFHHDPELTRVILSGSNHTIMIEGPASLAAVEGRLPAIVAAHGRSEPDPADATRTVKRIDQVMIAGHGSSQSIELAGTLASNPDGTPRTDTEGDLVTSEDDLNLRVDPADPATAARAARTRTFMTTLMGFMSSDASSPHRRVVFNACLTASNEINPDAVDPNASPDEQARQMRAAIAGSPSLVTAMRGIAPGVDVRGGNGSFGRVGLVDGTGALDIVADGAVDAAGNARTNDPELTNPDKLVYVERGTDPGGCMSAVAECWANDRTTVIPAIQRRRAAALGTDWDETLIQALYERVETTHSGSGAAIASLAHVTEGFKELVSVEQSRAWMLTSLRNGGDWQHLHDRLSVHGSWTSQLFVPLVFFHGWLFHDAAKIPSFLSAVAAMTVRTARDYIYMPWLKPDKWPQLVPAAPGGAPDPGRLRLALRDLVDDATAIHGNTRSFLSALVTAGAFTVDVAGPLDGLMSADDALRALGLHPSQRAGAGRAADPAAPPPDANVDMNEDDVNESVVEAMSATGRVTATELYVRAQPTTRGRPHPRVLHQGDEVHIMGQFRSWYLLDHDGTRGYSHKSYIDLV